MNNDIIFWHALRVSFDFGFETFKRIKKVFKKPREAWHASAAFYQKHGFEKGLVEKIAKRKRIDPGKIFRDLLKLDIHAISYDSKEYPKILKEISSPPPILYYKGDISLASEKNLISVVGTRKATSYGKAAVQKIISGLASEVDCIIVSGMAFGIDSEAHKATLKNGLKTIAVLGSGLDDHHIYPQANLALSREILKDGLILSEHPPGSPSYASNFPRRNRIISGLSLGTVIIEANEPSGALITAFRALEQNREVFSVPGSIFAATSAGCHKIIQMGAKLTTSAEDILQELHVERNPRSTQDSWDPLLLLLAEKPLGFDEIAEKSKTELQTLSTKLLELELLGRVAKKGGMYYKV